MPDVVNFLDHLPSVESEPAPSLDSDADLPKVPGRLVKSRLGGGFIHELCGAKPVRHWLVKGAVLAKTLFLVVGEPGCGKSFLLLDLAMTMALAVVDDRHPLKWFGRKIKPCGVVYIAAEGQEDFLVRIHAWLTSKGLAPGAEMPVFLIPSAVDMRTDDVPTKDLIADIERADAVCRERYFCGVGIVIIDTLNRALAGGNDSNPEHIGAFVRNCNAVRVATGVTTIAIAHTVKAVTGRPGRTDPRGHGSIRGDNDGEIYVSAAHEGAPNSWQVTRNKAGPIGDRHEFRLYAVDVGVDEDKEPIQSCYVVPGAAEGSLENQEMRDASMQARTGKPHMTADGRSILPDNMTMILRALNAAIETEGVEPPLEVKCPHGRKAVRTDQWTAELMRSMPGDRDDADKFKDRIRKARDAAAAKMRNRGIIGMDSDWYWRTSKRVAMIDKPAGDNSGDAANNSNSAGNSSVSQDEFSRHEF